MYGNLKDTVKQEQDSYRCPSKGGEVIHGRGNVVQDKPFPTPAQECIRARTHTLTHALGSPVSVYVPVGAEVITSYGASGPRGGRQDKDIC